MLADEMNVGIDDDHEVLESDGCSVESADDDSEDEFADELYIAGDTGNESFSVETAEEIRAVAGPQDYITDEMLRGMSDNGWELLPVTDERDGSDLSGATDVFTDPPQHTASVIEAAKTMKTSDLFFYYMPKTLWTEIAEETNRYERQTRPERLRQAKLSIEKKTDD
ncbi:hypothetical protein PF005_g31843, partial [Phytophthora fragariae]